MAGRVLKAQKVVDPVVRTVEIQDMYDHSLNDLEETWNDLGKLKSTLRNIGHRVGDAVYARPTSASAISLEPQRKAKQPGEPLECLPHYRPRKVCRLDEKYTDVDADGRINMPHCRPASSRHVAFKNFDSGDDTGSRLSNRVLGNDSKNVDSFNLTDSRAERETERKFLNDSVSPVVRSLPDVQRALSEPDMEPWSRRVNVRIPKAPPTTGTTNSGENTLASFDVRRKRATVKDVVGGDLTQLQETIRRQRAKSSQTVGSDIADYVHVSSTRAAEADDQHLPAASEYLPAASNVRPRKVASLPAAKAYLGFSRPQQLSPRISKQAAAKSVSGAPSDTVAVSLKKVQSASAQQQQQPVAECTNRADAVRIAVCSNKITPSSWRAGLRLVRQELGLPVSAGDTAASRRKSNDAHANASQSPRVSSAPAAGTRRSLHPSRADDRSAVATISKSVSGIARASQHSSAAATALPVSSRSAVPAGGSVTTAMSAAGAVEAADSPQPAAEGALTEPIGELAKGIAAGSHALSDTAKDVLRELQADAGLHEKRPASRKIGWDTAYSGSPEQVAVKRQLRSTATANIGAGPSSSKNRGQAADGRASASTPPPQKARHYDAEDIQRYMQRKKSEERRQRAAEAAAKRKADEEHQRKLQELYKKQRRVYKQASTATTRLSQVVTSVRVAARPTGGPSGAGITSEACNDTFTHSQLASSGGSSGVPAADSDKENCLGGAGSATPTSGSRPPSSHATPDRSTTGSARSDTPGYPANVGRDTPSPVSRPVVVASSAGVIGDDGLLSFADDNLKRILNKYKSRQQSDLGRTAAATDVRPMLLQRPAVEQPSLQLSGPLSTDPSTRSHVDRIASIKKATSLLTEKIHAAQARLADYCFSGQPEPVGSRSSPRHGHKERGEVNGRIVEKDREHRPNLIHLAPRGRGQLSATRAQEIVTNAIPHAPARSFASSTSEECRRSMQDRMLNSWPGGSSGDRTEQAPRHRTWATVRGAEPVSSLSDSSEKQSVPEAHADSAQLNEYSESQEDQGSDATATDSLTAEPEVPESAGVADRIARSLRPSAFCMSSRQADTENLFATHPYQLSYCGSAVPQRTAGQLLHTANGFEDAASQALSRSSSPRSYADYYSSINVHLRKASASRRGAAEQGGSLSVRYGYHEPVTSIDMQRVLHGNVANAAALTAIYPERARSPERPSIVADAVAAAAVDMADSRPVTFSLPQDAGASLPDARVVPVDACRDANSSSDQRFESGSRPMDGPIAAACTNTGDSAPAAGVAFAGRTVSPMLPAEEPSSGPQDLRHVETLRLKMEDNSGMNRLPSHTGQPYPSVAARTGGSAETNFGTSPLGLGFRMAAELNLLDSVEESVRALTDVELTRHAAAAQQEAARLTLLLEGTKHSQELELRQLRAKVRAEEEEAQRQLEAVRRHARTAELERDSALDERRRMESHSLTLYHSTRQLVESQMDATRASLEATRSLAEVAAAAGRDEHIRRREAAQIAAEAASLSAAAAVTASLDRQRQEQAEFFRMARQHVYDRSVQVSASLKPDGSKSDDKYGTSFDSASDEPQASLHGREGRRASPKATDDEVLSGPNSTSERTSTSPSLMSQASPTDSHSSATIVESEHVRTADVSSVSMVSTEADVVGRKRTSSGGLRSDSSVATASSLAEAQGVRGGAVHVRDGSISSIATDADVHGNVAPVRASAANEESVNSSSVKTLSDVQAIVHRQAAVEASRRGASSSSPSASVLTTEAVRLHDRQTAASDRGLLPLDVGSGRTKPQQLALDCIGSTSSDGSTVRSESGAYGSPKAVANEAADEDYTQDFYETSNASADESSADAHQAGIKRRAVGPGDRDKQRSPRVQKLAPAGEAAMPSTSPDDTGKVHTSRAAAAASGSASGHSASHALAVVRQLIRDEKLRALHEEQLARAKYRAINYKSKFELQTVATQKEIASLKGNTDAVAELETRAAVLAESFARKKAAIQSKLRSDRSYNNSRLESLRERYVELAAAAKDLGAGVAAQLAELSAPLDDVDLSLSESSISSSAGETNVDFAAIRTIKNEQGGNSRPAAGSPAALSEGRDGREDSRSPTRGVLYAGNSVQSVAPDVVDRSVARTSAVHAEDACAQSGESAAKGGSPRALGATEARTAAGQAARRKLLVQQVAAGSRAKPTHGDSESDDSISMSVPEGGTGSESDTEGRVQALQYQLRLKQKEETRLKRLLTDAERERRRERKRNQETALLKQLELTEENISRLNASLREVQQQQLQRHLLPSSDGTEGGAPLLRTVHTTTAPASGTPAAASLDPACSTASITKPLIKQPRAALQQLSASSVTSSASLSPVIPSTAAETARLPSGVLPSLRSDSEGSLRSTSDVEGDSPVDHAIRTQPEAAKSPDVQTVDYEIEDQQAPSSERPCDDQQSAAVASASRDGGDTQTAKEYSSDSFADSYSSEEPRENDESKSESVPEEIPEEVLEDELNRSRSQSESEDSIDANHLSNPDLPMLLPREGVRSPTVTAAGAAAQGTSLKETGSEYSVAESFDDAVVDEQLSAGPRSLSESSSEAPGSRKLSDLLPDPPPGPTSPHTPNVGDPEFVADVGSDYDRTPVAARDSLRFLVGAEAEVQQVSTDSDIAEEDMPVSSSSDGAVAHENTAKLFNNLSSGIASEGGTTKDDLAEPLTDVSAVLPQRRAPELNELAAADGVPYHVSSSELPAESSLLDEGTLQVEKEVLDKHAADQYDSEHFDSDFSTASISIPSEHSRNSQRENASVPVSSPDVPRSAFPAVGMFTSAAASEADTAGAAVLTMGTDGKEGSIPDAGEAFITDKQPAAISSESDSEGSDKDASWSASDDGKLQKYASTERGRRGEETVRTSGSGKVRTLSQESSTSESIHEALEHEPSATDSEKNEDQQRLEAVADAETATSSLSPLAAEPKEITVLPEPVPDSPPSTSKTADTGVSSTRSSDLLVEKLAEWLLKDAMVAYVSTRNSKLEAARATETTFAAAPAPATSGSAQKPVATLETSAALSGAVRRDTIAVADSNVLKAPEKDTPRNRTDVLSSASAASLADLPPLTPKKALAFLPEASGSSAGTAESSRPATSVSAKQPAATSAVAGGGALQNLPESKSEAKSSRPLSPVLGGSGPIVVGPSSDADDAWIKLDKEINSVFGEDVDWFDEDFGLGVSKKPGASPTTSALPKPGAAPQPPPPPYPGVAEGVKHASKAEVKVQAPPAPVIVIPEKREDVVSLALRAVDVFWQMRRCGESWEAASPPDEYTAAAVGSAVGLEGASKASHSRMMFDLVGEMLREIYKEESESDTLELRRASGRLKLPSRRYWKGKTPPSTVDELKKVVEQHVFKIIGCQPQVKNIGIGPRARKKDRVDGILIEELRQEEADWVNYSNDEDAVKETVFNDIFNLLIVDAGKSIAEAMRLTQRYSK